MFVGNHSSRVHFTLYIHIRMKERRASGGMELKRYSALFISSQMKFEWVKHTYLFSIYLNPATWVYSQFFHWIWRRKEEWKKKWWDTYDSGEDTMSEQRANTAKVEQLLSRSFSLVYQHFTYVTLHFMFVSFYTRFSDEGTYMTSLQERILMKNIAMPAELHGTLAVRFMKIRFQARQSQFFYMYKWFYMHTEFIGMEIIVRNFCYVLKWNTRHSAIEVHYLCVVRIVISDKIKV